MTDLENVLIYLVIAVIFVSIANFRKMDCFRRKLNNLANDQIENLNAAKIIAGSGDKKEIQIFAGRQSFRLTIGMRLLSTALYWCNAHSRRS